MWISARTHWRPLASREAPVADTPKPGLLTLEALPPDDTDPELFRPSPDDTETTKRRCGNCGTEIGPDESAFLRGAVLILNTAYRRMINAGISVAEAQAVADDLAKLAGLEGVL
jgi:hypothetical protein